jgi:lycopene cyclase domain-containing protein
MFEYLLISAPFLVVAVLFASRLIKSDKDVFILTLLLMLVFTVFFDSLIILARIVDYNFDKTLGIRIWEAPVEDLSYTVFATAATLNLWKAKKWKP